jgi:hypothetical protein
VLLDESAQYAVVRVPGDDVLNVRAGAGVRYEVVSTLSYNAIGVRVTGPGTTTVDGALWVPVQHDGAKGWVNSSYLAPHVGAVEAALSARTAEAILALRDRDMVTLSGLVHPEKGVRFSPYTFVQVEPGPMGDQDLVFGASEVAGLMSDPAVYQWGLYDGSGEPIEGTFPDYYGRFVYDADFAQPNAIGYDRVVGRGNTINNIDESYPQSTTVEYHFEGFDPQLAGMDWRSLRLVFERLEGAWYLVGIVHDEWTI